MLLWQLILRRSVRNFSTTFQMYKYGLKVGQTNTTERVEDRYVIDFESLKAPQRSFDFSPPNVQISVSTTNHKLTRK